MKIRPQIEVPSVKQGASVTSQTQGGTQSHFDAALLQAAQTVWDSSDQDAEAPLSPKVEQALSSALEQLNQKTTAQLQDLARAPQSIAALTAGLVQADGLNKAQATQLNRLLMAALPRLLAYKANLEVQGTSGMSSLGTQSAQGTSQGRPLAETFSSGVSAFGANQGNLDSTVDALASDTTQSQEPGKFRPLTTAAQFQEPGSLRPWTTIGATANGNSPVQPSGGVSFLQDNQAFVGLSNSAAQPLAGGTASTPATNTPASGPSQGRVFSVMNNPGPVGFGSPALVRVSEFTATGDNAANQNSTVSQGSVNGTLGSGQTQNLAQNQVRTQGTSTGTGQNQPTAPAENQNDTTETGFPVILGLDVQWTDNSVSVPVQEGSQITLKGDGSWVLPQGATVPAPKPQNQAGPQQSTAPVPDTTGQQGQQTNPVQEESNLFTGLGPQAFTPQTGPSDEVQTPSTTAPVFVNAGSSLELALQDVTQQEDGTTQTFGNGTQPTSPQTTGQQASAPSQVLSSQQLTAQSPSLTQVFQAGPQGQPQTNGKTISGLDPSPGGLPQAFAGALTAQVQGAIDSGNGSQSGQGFGGALSSFGQNSLSLWGSDVLAGGISQQVTNALNQTGAAPGRLVIQLSPASLGNVQVDLSMVDGKLTAHLVTSQQDVRDVLARDLTGFKAGLESHGITVNEVSVALRSGVGDPNQRSPRQTGQNGWEGFSQTPSVNPGAASAPGGASAYAEASMDGQPGFSALA